MIEISVLQKVRYDYRPKLPGLLAKNGPRVEAVAGHKTKSLDNQREIKALFPKTCGQPLLTFKAAGKKFVTMPLKVGVILSGGQAPGGHNVIAGLFDALKALHPGSQLYGFLGGPSGLVENRHRKLDAAAIDAYRNTGGFDMIGSGRTKLEKIEQFDKAVNSCQTLGIQALVIVGGDDSNTNACMLAEYVIARHVEIQVIGCPKTIDGDLKNKQVEISFGFDTATKLYSELIGNIGRDANSARKYWHFIKLMGRSASHVTLECALQTHPNVTVISEEVAAKRQTLKEVVTHIAGVIRDRAAAKMNFGIVLVPEGLIEFIPEINRLMAELNDLLATHEAEFTSLHRRDERLQFIRNKLSASVAIVFDSLPPSIRAQLLADRDSFGQVQVSRIETEKLLMDMVADQLKEWASQGQYGGKFSAQSHFLGYEGRCSAPSNFDSDYSYSLGYTAAALIAAGKTGYMASVGNLAEPAAKWIPGGVPLTMMMNLERRKGKDVPVIRKCLVDLEGKPFREFAKRREQWAQETNYVYPGPIQYFGPPEVCDRITRTLDLE